MKSQTSVNLEQKQLDFIKKFNINLSAFVRQKIDNLMRKYKDGGLIK